MAQEDREFDTLPTALVDALRELDGPAVLPSAERDADVLSGARLHLLEAGLSRKRRGRLRLFVGGAAGGAIAAAAMVGIVVMLGEPSYDEPQANIAMTEMFLPGDLNASGDIDILDAYALARQIEFGTADASLDLDQDGKVDQGDIDWIANRAVLLNPGEQS